MKHRRRLFNIVFSTFTCFSLFTTAQAQSSCDTCAQLTTLNTYSEDSNTTLNKLLERVTYALFGTLPALGNGNTMAAFSIIPSLNSNAYQQQQTMLTTVETNYQGRDDDDKTLNNNYHRIFNDFLLKQEGSISSFDEKKASISSLYIDPSKPTFYNDTQQAQAEAYIQLASGVAVSQMRKPSATWLTIGSNENSDKTNIRKKVGSYYTYSALQSAIADNFAYIYGLNKGKKITGNLKDYSESSISESGLFTYIQKEKPENPAWYSELTGMGVVSLLREQTILLGASFLMLARIEADLRRILVTNSAQATIALIGTQTLSDKLNQTAPTQ